MIEVNKHRKDYLKNKANEIVGFIQNMPKIQPNHNLPFGSKGEKRVLDITDQLKDKPQRFRTQTISDKPIDCIEEYQQKTYGLNEDSYKKYEKLKKNSDLSVFEKMDGIIVPGGFGER